MHSVFPDRCRSHSHISTQYFHQSTIFCQITAKLGDVPCLGPGSARFLEHYGDHSEGRGESEFSRGLVENKMKRSTVLNFSVLCHFLLPISWQSHWRCLPLGHEAGQSLELWMVRLDLKFGFQRRGGASEFRHFLCITRKNID
jgi:hypothetical protein